MDWNDAGKDLLQLVWAQREWVVKVRDLYRKVTGAVHVAHGRLEAIWFVNTLQLLSMRL